MLEVTSEVNDSLDPILVGDKLPKPSTVVPRLSFVVDRIPDNVVTVVADGESEPEMEDKVALEISLTDAMLVSLTADDALPDKFVAYVLLVSVTADAFVLVISVLDSVEGFCIILDVSYVDFADDKVVLVMSLVNFVIIGAETDSVASVTVLDVVPVEAAIDGVASVTEVE